MPCQGFDKARNKQKGSAIMLARMITAQSLVLGIFCSGALAQRNARVSAVPGAREFPVVMQQSVVAGKTPVGTKVRAKLEVATPVNGRVVPRKAVLSGEVLESRGKS